MSKYYKVKVSIIFEEFNKTDVLIREQNIIIEKKFNYFKEIATGLQFRNQNISAWEIVNLYRTDHKNKFVQSIKEYGFYYLIEPNFFKEQNPLVTTEEARDYLNQFKSSIFAMYLSEYKEKNNQNNIKKLIKEYKKKGDL